MRTAIKILTLLLVCACNTNAQLLPMPIGTGSTPYNPGVTSWNPFDKNPNMALSNNFLTVTSFSTISGFEMVRCNKVCSTGVKQYFEVTLTANGFDAYVGFDIGTGSLSAQPGSGSNAVAYYASLGEILVNGIQVQTGLVTSTTGDILDVLYDGSTTVTFKKGGSTIGIAQIVAGGNYFPMVGRGSGSTALVTTTNFGATTPSFTYATYTLGPP